MPAQALQTNRGLTPDVIQREGMALIAIERPQRWSWK
jgi:hypothetical protein